ncbi:MAG: hypothetical protein KDD38_01280 [Bdellovibrionales bacterium]|nr:hypothetical protein [Bdellovibrionales bacterium]
MKTAVKISYFSMLTLILAASCMLISASGCAPKKDSAGGSAAALYKSGDIIVTNAGSDAVLVLTPDGDFKNVLFDVDNTSETVTGVSYLSTGEILVVVEGTDRIVAVNNTGVSRNFVTHAQYTGNVYGVTQLASGDILAVETNNVERFDLTGSRVSTGGWPLALQSGGRSISAISTGGFIHCSSTADVLRTYNDAGTQQATVASGIAGTTDAFGCTSLANGNVAVAWSGTTDTVRVYDSTLTTTVASYSDIGRLAAPTGIAERANGNILVLDSTFNYIVELTSALAFSRIIGDDVLSTPQYIMVVP